MFERYTDRAKKVMALANQEALRFNHDYIGTEHILLGLIKEGSGVGGAVLKNLDVNLKQLRQGVLRLVKAEPKSIVKGKLPLHPQAKKVLEQAIAETKALNHNYVGTEHLLLSLLRETEGIATQVLIDIGLKFEDVRKEILMLLGAGIEDTANKKEDTEDVSNQKQNISYQEAESLTILIDPGQATAEGIGELFFRLSELYKMMGGSGLEFRTTDVREGVVSNV